LNENETIFQEDTKEKWRLFIFFRLDKKAIYYHRRNLKAFVISFGLASGLFNYYPFTTPQLFETVKESRND
jgi:hypothetical protein